MSVYPLEYPGCGARPGSPSQQAFLAAAADALQSVPGDVPVIVVRESLGSGVAAATATSHPERVAGLLLLTPFDSLVAVAQHHHPVLLPRSGGDGRGRRDSAVPAQFGRRLHDAYPGPKLLIKAADADHNDLLYLLPESAWAQALAFLEARSGL